MDRVPRTALAATSLLFVVVTSPVYADMFLRYVRTPARAGAADAPVSMQVCTTSFWFSADRALKIEQETAELVDFSSRKVWTLDHTHLSYDETPLDSFAQYMREALADLGDTPEAQAARRIVEFLMREARVKAKVRQTGTVNVVNGLRCRRYNVTWSTPQGGCRSEVWATEDIPLNAQRLATMRYLRYNGVQGFEEAVAEIARVRGVPVLETTSGTTGRRRMETVLRLVEYGDREAPAGLYDIPQGYSKKPWGLGLATAPDAEETDTTHAGPAGGARARIRTIRAPARALPAKVPGTLAQDAFTIVGSEPLSTLNSSRAGMTGLGYALQTDAMRSIAFADVRAVDASDVLREVRVHGLELGGLSRTTPLVPPNLVWVPLLSGSVPAQWPMAVVGIDMTAGVCSPNPSYLVQATGDQHTGLRGIYTWGTDGYRVRAGDGRIVTGADQCHHLWYRNAAYDGASSRTAYGTNDCGYAGQLPVGPRLVVNAEGAYSQAGYEIVSLYGADIGTGRVETRNARMLVQTSYSSPAGRLRLIPSVYGRYDYSHHDTGRDSFLVQSPFADCRQTGLAFRSAYASRLGLTRLDVGIDWSEAVSPHAIGRLTAATALAHTVDITRRTSVAGEALLAYEGGWHAYPLLECVTRLGDLLTGTLSMGSYGRAPNLAEITADDSVHHGNQSLERQRVNMCQAGVGLGRGGKQRAVRNAAGATAIVYTSDNIIDWARRRGQETWAAVNIDRTTALGMDIYAQAGTPRSIARLRAGYSHTSIWTNTRECDAAARAILHAPPDDSLPLEYRYTGDYLRNAITLVGDVYGINVRFRLDEHAASLGWQSALDLGLALQIGYVAGALELFDVFDANGERGGQGRCWRFSLALELAQRAYATMNVGFPRVW